MKIVDCVQGSREWADARRGLITASRMGDIITPKTMKLGAGAMTYACELIADAILPAHYWRGEEFTSSAMANGTNTEREARDYFALITGQDVQQVGLCISDCGRFACSPDGLVGDDAGLEIKVPLPKTQVRWLLDGRVPNEHVAQCHGSMIVSQRKRWFFLSYSPGLPPLLVENTPTDYTVKLAECLEEFWTMLQSMRERVLGGGDPVAATREPFNSPF